MLPTGEVTTVPLSARQQARKRQRRGRGSTAPSHHGRRSLHWRRWRRGPSARRLWQVLFHPMCHLASRGN